MAVLLGALLSGVAAKMRAKCVQMSGKAMRFLCAHPPLLFCPPNQNCHAMQAKNFQKPCAQPGRTNPQNDGVHCSRPPPAPPP